MASHSIASLSLARVNMAPPDVAAKLLDGVYEHAPWPTAPSAPWLP